MTDDIFNKEEKEKENITPDNQEGGNENPADVNELFADQLKGIVNEQGKPKYSSVEEALKALKHSQEFIGNLISENKQFKEKISEIENEVEKRKSVEEIVESLYQRRNDSDGRETPDPERFDENTVLELVKRHIDSELSGRELENKRKENKSYVNKELFEKYGPETRNLVNAKLESVGLTIEQFEKLSAETPKVALALFNQSPTSGSSVTTGSINIPNHKKQSDIPKPEKSLMMGATEADKLEYFKKVKEAIYNKYNVGQ